MSEVKDADTEKRDVLRKKLYNKLKKRYKRLVNMGIIQIQFHTNNNISFLRMNNIEKFGDDLSEVRPSVAQTNRTQKPTESFEVGKTTHAFRFVYPFFKDKEHIGSVEISFSSAKLISTIVDNVMLHTHFLVSKEEVYKQRLSLIRDAMYEPCLENVNFLL